MSDGFPADMVLFAPSILMAREHIPSRPTMTSCDKSLPTYTDKVAEDLSIERVTSVQPTTLRCDLFAETSVIGHGCSCSLDNGACALRKDSLSAVTCEPESMKSLHSTPSTVPLAVGSRLLMLARTPRATSRSLMRERVRHSLVSEIPAEYTTPQHL